jgi:hypothetical protein
MVIWYIFPVLVFCCTWKNLATLALGFMASVFYASFYGRPVVWGGLASKLFFHGLNNF